MKTAMWRQKKKRHTIMLKGRFWRQCVKKWIQVRTNSIVELFWMYRIESHSLSGAVDYTPNEILLKEWKVHAFIRQNKDAYATISLMYDVTFALLSRSLRTQMWYAVRIVCLPRKILSEIVTTKRCHTESNLAHFLLLSLLFLRESQIHNNSSHFWALVWPQFIHTFSAWPVRNMCEMVLRLCK